MRKLFVTEFVTLDGVMEAPGGEPSHPHTGWVMGFVSPEQNQWKLEETLATETLLVGRVTYESFAGAWPTYEGTFADKMNSMEKVVFSNTLTDPAWTGTRVVSGDLVEAITALKAGDGGDIQVPGSRRLVHGLLEAGLVDELRLMVFPVSIGEGFRVFPDAQIRQVWTRVESIDFPDQVRMDIYRPG
jgi:dihydrofolate reductase